jgi:hypothetical protein
MKVLKSLSILSGVGAMVLAVAFASARADETTTAVKAQSQPQRTTARTSAARRSQRAYSYEPSRGGDIARRAASPSFTRADTKVKFRYGSYPY